MPTVKGEADINLKGEKDIGYVNWTQEMSIHSDDDMISGNQFKDLMKEFYLNIMKELTVMISVKRLESAMWRM